MHKFRGVEWDILAGNFDSSELVQAKLATLSKSANEYLFTSEWWIERFCEHYAGVEASPSKYFYKYTWPHLVASITLSQIDSLVSQIGANSADLLFWIPAGSADVMPSQGELSNWLASEDSRIKKTMRDARNQKRSFAIPARELTSPKYTLHIDSTTDAYYIRMDHGTEIIIKAVPEEQRVQVRAIRQYPVIDLLKTDFDATVAAPFFVKYRLPVGFGKLQWDVFREKNSLQMRHIINDNFVGVEGFANSNAIGPLLSVLADAIKRPLLSRRAYKKLRNDTYRMKGRQSSLDSILVDLYGGIDVGRKFKFDLSGISFKQAKRCFETAFPKSGKYRFVITGAFDLKMMEEVAIQHVCPLDNVCCGTPIIPSSKKVKAHARHPLMHGLVMNNADSSRMVNLQYYSDVNDTADDIASRAVLKSIFKTRLFAELREKKGGVYSVHLLDEYLPFGGYKITVSFHSYYGDIDVMADIVFKEGNMLAEEGVTSEEVNSAILNEIENVRQRAGGAAFWQEFYGKNVAGSGTGDPVEDYLKALKRVTPSQVQNSAARHIRVKIRAPLIPFSI